MHNLIHICCISLILLCLGPVAPAAGQGGGGNCIADLRRGRSEALAAMRVGDSLPRIDGQAFRTAVIVFYKTDCPFCERLLPELKALQESYGNKGLEVYALCLDENSSTWQAYITAHGYEAFRNYCDGRSYTGPMAAAYHVFATPSLFLLDADWRK